MKTKDKSGLKKGDLVIMNDTEVPCGRSIAIVTSIKKLKDGGYKIFAKYISKSMCAKYGKNKYCFAVRESLDFATPTKIEDFGVQFASLDDVAFIHKDNDGVAKYDDGFDRKWQGFGTEDIESFRLRGDFYELWDKANNLR